MEQSFSDISLYHEYRSARETEHLVSQKTWDDLNLDDFFEWADRTSSCVGRQYLYDVLHYNRLSEISEQEEVIRKLSVNPEKPDVPLNKNDAFQKVQKRRVQEKR